MSRSLDLNYRRWLLRRYLRVNRKFSKSATTREWRWAIGYYCFSHLFQFIKSDSCLISKKKHDFIIVQSYRLWSNMKISLSTIIALGIFMNDVYKRKSCYNKKNVFHIQHATKIILDFSGKLFILNILIISLLN